MNENSPLKIAVFISLGLHLLFLGVASGLFGISSQVSASYVRVRFLPFGGGNTPGLPGNSPGTQKTEIKNRNKVALNHPTPARKTLQALQSSSESILYEKPKIIFERPETGKKSSEINLNNGNKTVSLKIVAFTEDKSLASPASINFGGMSEAGPSDGDGSGEASGIGSGNRGSGNGVGILGNIFHGDGWGNGGIPRYVKKPEKNYPPEAKEKGYQGNVLLRVEILPNGHVGQIKIKRSSGHSILDCQAISDMKLARFMPAMDESVASSIWVNIPFEFQLQ